MLKGFLQGSMPVAVAYLSLLLIPLLYYVWTRLSYINTFFKRRGIKHMKPKILFGNLLPTVAMEKSQFEVMEDLYNAFPDEPLAGYYNFTTPYLVVQNAEYAENVLIKDFANFTDHGFERITEKTQNPFDESIFTMRGQRWRAFRYKLSPVFTAGKLRRMFPSMIKSVNGLLAYLKKNQSNLDVKNAGGLFSLEAMGSSIFGIDSKVIENPDSEYHRLGKKSLDMTPYDFFKFFLILVLPGFMVRRIGLTFMKHDVVEYFSKIVRDTLKYRRENNVQRNDLIQLLLQLKLKEKIDLNKSDPNDEYYKCEEVTGVKDYFDITDEFITVHAFSFLTGGYDTLSLTILYTCFELAQNPQVQERVRKEIREQMKLHDGFTYEAMKNMSLLENCVKEALRLHSVVPGIMRTCTKDYTFPNGYQMKKGEALQIPARCLHMNPNYFDEPEAFRPERFYEPIKPGSFIAFGDGPRICMAMRYAYLHTKIAVSTILINYKMKLNPKTVIPLKTKALSFFATPKSDVLLDLEPIVT